MRRRWVLLTLLMISPTLARAAEAPAPPAAKLPHFDFENGIVPWTALTGVGQVAASTPGRAGQMALAFHYEAKKGEMPILALPVDAGLAGMGSLRFDLSTDSPTLLVVALVEAGEARYQYLTATPAKGWMHLEIDRSEFTRAEDSQDTDNRLDLDQVRYVVLMDLRAVLTAEANPMAGLFGLRKGAHSLWIDNFQAVPERAVTPDPDGRLIIDDFRRENLGWTPLDGVALSVGTAPGGAAGRALRLDYTTEAGKLAAVLRTFEPGTLTGVGRIAFAAAAERQTSLAVVLEETGGARYQATVMVPGGGRIQRYGLAVSDLKLAEDTKDQNGRLDLNQVKSLGFIDLAGLAGAPPPGKSVLWLQDVRAIPVAR